MGKQQKIYTREFKFIAEQRQVYPIKTMCRVLEVAESGYYAWRQRAPSQRSQENTVLGEQIARLYQSNRQVYGSPRIHAALRARSASSAGAGGWLGSCASKA
jgi:hypothetical protein